MSNPNLVRKSATSTMPGEASFNEISAAIGGGGGGGGLKNYISNPDFDGGQTTNWAMRKVSLSSLVPTGNIGAADAGHTIAASSSSPLEGANSLLVQGASLFTAGNCLVSDAFAIDRQDQAKVMGWSFYYEAVTANMDFPGTSAGTWAVYIAEVTTATPDTVVSWIQPAGVYNLIQSSGAGIASGTFQTTAAGTAYRLVLVCINSEAAATTLKVDDFQLGPQSTVQGAAISDWVDFTPVGIDGFSSAPTVSIAKYRRVGGNIEVQYSFVLTGAPNNFLRFPIPSGFTIDVTKGTVLGYAVFYDSAPGVSYSGLCVQDTGNKIIVSLPSGSGPYWNGALNLPFAGSAAGDLISLNFSAPIIGLSSNTVLSQDTDTRVVAASAHGGPATALGGNPVIFPSSTLDTHASYSTSTGRYTVPVSGRYRLSYAHNSANTYLVTAYINAVNTGIVMGSVISGAGSGSVILDLQAGQIVDHRPSGSTGAFSGSGGNFSIERLSGPATIAASETVACRYKDSSGANIPGSAGVFKYTTKDYDTHGFYSTSTGLATIPVSGKYSVTASIASSFQTLGVQQGLIIELYKNSAVHSRLGVVIGNGNGNLYFTTGSDNVQCVAGDTLAVYATWGAGVAVPSLSDENFNHISIHRVGN